MKLLNTLEDFQQFYNRVRIAAAGAGLLFLILFGRFFWLQVLQYDRYHALAESNRIALVPAVPARGAIYDRNGAVLAHNFSAHTLEITPSKTTGLEDTLDRLSKIVQIDAADRKRFKRLLAESKNFESIPIRNKLTEEEEARFAVNRFRFPGVEVRARLFRLYPFGDSFAHVIGYIGRVNDNDLDNLRQAGEDANYRGTDHIGKLGVEKSYEPWLHGRTGIEKVEVDSSGKAVRLLSRTPPLAGNNIHLYLDAKLQQVAESSFGELRGALVALDPRNGGVLALVSKPGFDPNLFVDGIDPTSWKELNDSLDRPLINRALRGVYPPGSTFKPFMALAGLELGLRKPSDAISDPGYYSLPGSSHRYRDWKAGGHGMVDLQKSIVISCDTYYYQLAHLMGIQRMHDFLDQFGFGRKTEVDLDGELPGVLPSPEWKRKRFKQIWWPGETVIAGIGQGYNLATPMQLAVATMTIANDGTVYKPRLIRAWSDPGSGRLHYAAPEVLRRVDLKAENLRVVKEAMAMVTQPGGTASSAFAGAPYLAAGKTGTAQVIGIKQNERYSESRVAMRNRDHALFIAFAPVDAPKIVVAVMVENGGHGGSIAAPIAREVIDYWLLGKLPTQAAPAPPANPDAVPDEEQEDSVPADAASMPAANALREEAQTDER
ncbi:penicillin-binding protein 2 [Parasulfuritortus cantonensis]|uniref:Peptidoglycan D,D-transpeptidase MrdA n=1 Tax=Parasulfuritortus cantonensis TaxID=2528202 RepID=A0A4R1B5J4_9PROT|nr:penicillin-binding protein 2 [Parasulfuritortus cantonensis]TCJ12780.1 penicillin-binding protein 2 [Parasulfuritortus cantonensis]